MGCSRVKPEEASRSLHEIEHYLRTTPFPDRTRVASRLRRIRDSIVGDRVAAQVGNFTRHELNSAVHGIQALTDKLQKAARTMNEQDPGRKDLEREIGLLTDMKGELLNSYKSVSALNI